MMNKNISGFSASGLSHPDDVTADFPGNSKLSRAKSHLSTGKVPLYTAGGTDHA